jgi:hypothetical protein
MCGKQKPTNERESNKQVWLADVKERKDSYNLRPKNTVKIAQLHKALQTKLVSLKTFQKPNVLPDPVLRWEGSNMAHLYVTTTSYSFAKLTVLDSMHVLHSKYN